MQAGDDWSKHIIAVLHRLLLELVLWCLVFLCCAIKGNGSSFVVMFVAIVVIMWPICTSAKDCDIEKGGPLSRSNY